MLLRNTAAQCQEVIGNSSCFFTELMPTAELEREKRSLTTEIKVPTMVDRQSVYISLHCRPVRYNDDKNSWRNDLPKLLSPAKTQKRTHHTGSSRCYHRSSTSSPKVSTMTSSMRKTELPKAGPKRR